MRTDTREKRNQEQEVRWSGNADKLQMRNGSDQLDRPQNFGTDFPVPKFNEIERETKNEK